MQKNSKETNHYLTIITPTFNRAYIIENLFLSLKRQTCKKFEWIVVDDGSSDDTYDLIEKWFRDNNAFQIKVLRQENGGKHRAVNRGVEQATGDYVLIVDSDDILTDDAVEWIYIWISETDNNPKIAAVSGNRGRKTSKTLIGSFPQRIPENGYVDAKNNQRRRRHLLGDKAEIYRSDLLRKYPFPEFDGEKFISEAAVWDEVAYQGFYVRWYNRIIYLCEYLNDGLTKAGAKKELENFQGFTYYTKQRIKCGGLLEGLIARGYYWNVSKKKGLSMKKAARLISSPMLSMFTGIFAWKMKNLFMGVKHG